MAYGHFKDLPRRTDSNKVLRDEVFNVDKNPNYDGYQRGLASMIYKCFDIIIVLIRKPQVIILETKICQGSN